LAKIFILYCGKDGKWRELPNSCCIIMHCSLIASTDHRPPPPTMRFSVYYGLGIGNGKWQ
jgi:hypothetical protein